MFDFLNELRPSKITDQTAKEYIKAGLFGAAYSVFSLLLYAWIDSSLSTLIQGIIAILLSFGIYKKNIHCAIILFIYSVINLIFYVYIYWGLEEMLTKSTIFTLLAICGLFFSIIGIFKLKLEKADKTQKRKTYRIIAIDVIAMISFCVIFNFINYSQYKYNLFFNSEDNKTNIEKTVVKIFYPYSGEPLSLESKGVWSSGIVINTDGMIITNRYIFSQDKNEYITVDKKFLVMLTDLETGVPEDIYIAMPYVFPELSEEYDLVISQIDSEYIDDKGISYGLYPKIFPAILGNDDYIEGLYECAPEDLQIGDAVLVMEHKSSAKDKKINLTKGIINEFIENKGIITSAKLNKINSGGLAITSRQCFLGMHSSYFSEKNNNAGYIISTNNIIDYFNKETELKKLLIQNKN